MSLDSPLVPQSAAVFLLMLTRIGTMLAFVPGFAGRSVPAQFKVLASLVLTIVLVPFSRAGGADLTAPGRFAAAVAQEFLVGLLLGFGVAVVFGAIEMASGLIGIQIGLNMAPVFNPSLSDQAMPLNTFYYVMAALVFFGANGHHLVLLALARSFQAIPVGTAGLADTSGRTLIGLTGTMFADALRIGLPVAGTVLLVDAALGLLNRMVPQMNVFFVGLPVKLFVGFAVLLLTLPFLLRMLTPMLTSGIYDSIGQAGAVAR